MFESSVVWYCVTGDDRSEDPYSIKEDWSDNPVSPNFIRLTWITGTKCHSIRLKGLYVWLHIDGDLSHLTTKPEKLAYNYYDSFCNEVRRVSYKFGQCVVAV